MIEGKEFHPACLLLPKMAKEEYEALRESIRKGFNDHHPILLHEGKILDGRHRYLACLDEGVPPVYREWTGTDPFVFVKTEHEARRSWTCQEQKAGVIGRLIDKSEWWRHEQKRIRDEANRKRAEAIQAQPRNDNGTMANKPVQPQTEAKPDYKKTKSSTAKATRTGTSRAAVERFSYLEKNAPDLADKVCAGEIGGAAAVREARKRIQAETLESISTKEIETTTGLFDVIVVDPPWPVKRINRDVRPYNTEFDYPTMSLDEVESINIPAAEHCHIWLWTTHKYLPHSFELLKKWGLKYVCTFVWHKPGGYQPFELPQYNCEFALYARKGAPSFIDLKKFPVCFNAKRGVHSEKPEEFYETLRRVTGGRRLDMFNRRPIDGFKAWGKECKP